MGEELSQAAMAESQQRERSQYYQRRLEELKADMEELVQREAEASRRCMELVSGIPDRGSCVMDGLRPGRGESLRPTGIGRKQGETGRGRQRDDAAIGCKPRRRAQSGPVAFTLGWSPRSFLSQTPIPASHVPLQRQVSSWEEERVSVD